MYDFFYTHSWFQNDQSRGSFSILGSLSLMRSCHNLIDLDFECSDCSACVASDGWGDLPVPPPKVIARGTQSVFQFVKEMLRGAILLRDEVIRIDCHLIDLKKDRKLSEDELLPLLKSLREGKFSELRRLNLVLSFPFNVMADCSHSCASVWQRNRRFGNCVDWRGAESQQKPSNS